MYVAWLHVTEGAADMCRRVLPERNMFVVAGEVSG